MVWTLNALANWLCHKAKAEAEAVVNLIKYNYLCIFKKMHTLKLAIIIMCIITYMHI